jgi:dsRNA-specific ribonuclease
MSNSDNKDDIKYILNETNKKFTKKYLYNTMKTYNIENFSITDDELKLFQTAMCHISYLERNEFNKLKRNRRENIPIDTSSPIQNEHIKKTIPLQKKSYEILEFVGDSVIHCILSDYLSERYKNTDEGFLTKLRIKIESGNSLYQLCRIINLHEYVLISRDLEKNRDRENNENILEDVFEAFIGALYKKCGYVICYTFMVNLIEAEIDFGQLLSTETNFKDKLVKYFHKMKWQDPFYNQLDTTGTSQNRKFTMCVKRKIKQDDEEEIVGMGRGTSKKKGEQEAARNALIEFGIIKIDTSSKEDSESYEEFDCDGVDFDDIEYHSNNY